MNAHSCRDRARLLPGYAEDKRLLAIGATCIHGNLADRGIEVEGMVIEDGIAWDNANCGDANSRTFFQPPETPCQPEIRPCVVGSHANTMVFGGSPSRYVSPMVAIVRAADGVFTDFGTQSVQGEQAALVDVMALGGGRVLAAGHTLTSDEEPLALTARLLPDRIFGSGLEP